MSRWSRYLCMKCSCRARIYHARADRRRRVRRARAPPARRSLPFYIILRVANYRAPCGAGRLLQRQVVAAKMASKGDALRCVAPFSVCETLLVSRREPRLSRERPPPPRLCARRRRLRPPPRSMDVQAKHLSTKQSTWRGRYARMWALTGAAVQNVDPVRARARAVAAWSALAARGPRRRRPPAAPPPARRRHSPSPTRGRGPR